MLPALCVAQKEVFADAAMSIDPGTFHLLHREYCLVLNGFIEIYESGPEGPHVMTVHGEHQFTGELDLFNDRDILVSGRMGADGTVARMSRPQFRRLLAQKKPETILHI